MYKYIHQVAFIVVLLYHRATVFKCNVNEYDSAIIMAYSVRATATLKYYAGTSNSLIRHNGLS